MKKIQPNIFIVEDDVMYLELIRHKLNEVKYTRVKVFTNAKDFLRALDETPDIVIVDYNLDSINGLTLLQKIKEHNPKTQVIFLSGQENPDVALNTLKYDAYDYIIRNKGALNRLVQLLERILVLEHVIQENLTYKKKNNVLKLSLIAITIVLIGMNVFFLYF